MAYVPEAHRPSSEPLPSTRASNRRLWNITYPARLAGVLLLLVWVGPVTFIQTDSWQLLKLVGAPERASADSRVIPAGRAMLLEPGTPLKLHLRDRSVLEGRFLGRTLLDSALYAPRFAAKTRSSSYVPFALGETLRVSFRDGREWTAAFAGYGEMTLLLRSPDGPEYLRVPFEFAREIRRANGDRVEPKTLARAFQRGLLPSAEALGLGERLPMGSVADQWAGALRVPVEDIQSATAELSSGNNVPGIVILSVFVTVVLVYVLIASIRVNSVPQSCGSVPSGSFAGVHLTTRPFDRSRGCFVGDPLAVADPWPGPTEVGPATALADPATSHVLAR